LALVRIPAVIVAGVVAVGFSAAPARASELRWDGDAACPDRDQLRFELERALGKPLADAGDLVFTVAVQRSADRVTARLRLDEGDAARDERVLIGESCAELTDTLAVAISLAIGRSDTDAEPPPPPPEAPARATAVTLDQGRRDETSVSAGPRPSALALVVADVGSLPHPAVGVGLGVAMSWDRVRLQLGALLFIPQRAELSAGSGVNAELGLTLGTASACTPLFRTPSGALSLPGCLGLELGRLEGVGSGVAAPHSREILWLAPRAEVGVSWALPDTRLSLEMNAAAVLPLNRDEFIFDGIGTVHRPSRVTGRLGANLNLTFD
jgi:hypothetical protein